MATIDSLNKALVRVVKESTSSQTHPLTDAQYAAGHDLLTYGPGWLAYQDFIIPQVQRLVSSLLENRNGISMLEIGPGPETVLEYLPLHLRQRVKQYTVYEPHNSFASKLEDTLSLDTASSSISPFPNLDTEAVIHHNPFTLKAETGIHKIVGTEDRTTKYDLILFCHSLYGMKPRCALIKEALSKLDLRAGGGIVVVFHRGSALQIESLVCQHVSHFPTGTIRIPKDDVSLDNFAAFVADFNIGGQHDVEAIRDKWRKVCRDLGGYNGSHPHHITFSSPEVMMVFTQHATALSELAAQMPLLHGRSTVKNRIALLQDPVATFRPTKIEHVQKCVKWAINHKFSLTVISGGHSGHCRLSNVVAIDLGAFDQVNVVSRKSLRREEPSNLEHIAIAGAGCTTESILRETMKAGVTVPLGSRPSVGAGLWLQGGIGHLTRQYGLTCDNIIGAVIVSVRSGEIFCIGDVPNRYWPVDAVRPESDADMLWAIKGAGTNFGIVVKVVFKTHPAPTYSMRKWIVPLADSLEASTKMAEFDNLIASKLPRECSTDGYLYSDGGKLHLGIIMFASLLSDFDNFKTCSTNMEDMWGPVTESKSLSSIELFGEEMYISDLHGGHAGGKTSSFKRCVFLKDIGSLSITKRLIAFMESKPSPLSYFHLIQGGGAVADARPDATAFGCRDWDFACVITGVWPRDQDETRISIATIDWVYKVTSDLIPFSTGIYGADIGPDPRDATLAARAFGPNRLRLCSLKDGLDPHNILAHTCPLRTLRNDCKLIVLVTGEHGAGKDYCADIWVSMFLNSHHKNITAQHMSISDTTKRDYARATGTDFKRLLHDRAYKEEHRTALTAFFHRQEKDRPSLRMENFMSLVDNATTPDVLIITGMREEAPVTFFSPLVPQRRVVEVYVRAQKTFRATRRGIQTRKNHDMIEKYNNNTSGGTKLCYQPSLIFDNDTLGTEPSLRFGERHLLPLLDADLELLRDMVQITPNFPSPGIDFHHVLGISRHPGGLALCTSLLQTHFRGDWARISSIVSCEAGGFVFAPALALKVNVPLLLVRESGKLPPPTVSTAKSTSFISSLDSSGLGSSSANEQRIEIESGKITKHGSVVIVDDVFSTGRTLCAVLDLLVMEGVSSEDIYVMVVAEFPIHGGREALRKDGYGMVNIQSLLVFGAA